MIPLYIQIRLIIFSLIFGIFFSVVLNINYKFIHSKHKIFDILISLTLVINMVFIYFIFIKKFCYGIFHFYSIILITAGFTIYNSINNYIKTKNVFKKIDKDK